jgi:hypothetical protein
MGHLGLLQGYLYLLLFMSPLQTPEQNFNIRISNKSLESVTETFWDKVTSQNFNNEEIKRKLNLRLACHESVENILSSNSDLPN